MTLHSYGWVPQLPDHRDRSYNNEEVILDAYSVPAKVDLWDDNIVPPIWNQLQLGSCTAHGSLRAWLIEAAKQGVSAPMLSRLMQYYDSRAVEGTTSTDAGAQVRDSIKVLALNGCAPETDWPYDISKFAEKPPAQAYTDAQKYMSVKYQAVTLGGPGAPMRTALSRKLAIVFGFVVTDQFEDGSWDPATQVLPLPRAGDGVLGGHCVAITGYDYSLKDFPVPYFICDNSWDKTWGWNGRFRMASSWFTPARGLASDFWVIQNVK